MHGQQNIKIISSCPVTFHRSLLEIIFGHHILNIYLRHLFTKVFTYKAYFKQALTHCHHFLSKKIGKYHKTNNKTFV